MADEETALEEAYDKPNGFHGRYDEFEGVHEDLNGFEGVHEVPDSSEGCTKCQKWMGEMMSQMNLRGASKRV